MKCDNWVFDKTYYASTLTEEVHLRFLENSFFFNACFVVEHGL